MSEIRVSRSATAWCGRAESRYARASARSGSEQRPWRQRQGRAREGRRGGRAARREARTTLAIRSLPVLERTVPVYEVLNQEGLELIHEASLAILEEVGIEFRDDEAARMWRDAGADVQRYRVRIPRAAADGARREEPEPLHRARAQSRAQYRDRRQQGRVRTDLRLAFRLRLQQPAALRHARGPQPVPQARLHGAVDAQHRGGDLRAGRHRDPQAPPAHHLQRDQALRQAVHGAGDRARARRGRAPDGADPVRRGVRRRSTR